MGDKNHAYFHESKGEESVRGDRKTKVLKHIFALYSLPRTFSKTSRSLRSVDSIVFYPPIKNAGMDRDFSNPSYIFLYFLVLLSPTASFQNLLEHV